MATKTIAWNDGSGNITLTYGGQGNGTILVQFDANDLSVARSQQVTVKTTDGSDIERTITIQQAAKVMIDISTAIVTVANQTYSGSAKTPTPTVTLNGDTIPSSGYDVSYSDNVNAGTATITVTGKGDYIGTATGTFTIAKASRTVSFSSPTTSIGKNCVAVNTASVSAGASDGTLSYSSSNTSVATVDSSGKVIGKSGGSVTITATISAGTNYQSASGTYTISVSSSVPNGEYIENTSGVLYTSSQWNSSSGSYRCVVLITSSYKLRIQKVVASAVRASSTQNVDISSANSSSDGYSNTTKLRSLLTSSAILGSGTTYLPAYDQITAILNRRTQLNTCLSKCGSTQIGSGIHWSSTYWGISNEAYCLKTSNGKGGMVKTNALVYVNVSDYS